MDGDGARAERLSTVLWVVTVAFGIAGAVLTLVVWSALDPRDGLPNLFSGLSGILYATLGAVIVRRARNPIGWILQGIALGLALLSFAGAYSVAGLVWRPGSFPGAVAAAGFAEWVFGPTLTALGFLLFLFPTGRLPSPRWRPVLVVGLVAAGITTIGFIVNPVTYGVPAPGGVSFRIANPGGIEALGDAISAVLVVSVLTVVAVAGAAFVSLIVRYRSAGRDERQQIKWLAFAAALALVSQAIAFGSLIACGCDNSPVANVAFIGTEVAAFIGIPAAITIAILRYRLYDIDVIINRALVYGLIATALTAIYVGVVAGVGALAGSSGSSTLTIVAAVAIALLFQPLRRRAQRLANRLVYGDRATPYQVLSDFAKRMAGTYALDDVLERMASILAHGTGATRVDVWLRVGGELRPVAAWPADAAGLDPIALAADDALPAFDVTRAVAVRHGAELFGALTLTKPRNEPLTPTEDKLVEDLASQAGLVLRNARLTAELQESVDELRASRRRLVEAQDEERRKIERNLHDGAQQQLVALTVQLGLLERLADDPEKVRQMAMQLQGGLRDALDDLRDLARGIYPPLLADKGLAVALEAQGRKAAVPTTIEPDGVGRYPREVEAAVYFCALEAMQNVAKYADARSSTVRLAERDGRLIFEIEDDGRGFDADATTYGTGVQGMADRLDAIGGTL
ncbi:MAG: GAF domain-containing sensor histidine kinase, partial [Actinomycetota bacterium]